MKKAMSNTGPKVPYSVQHAPATADLAEISRREMEITQRMIGRFVNDTKYLGEKAAAAIHLSLKPLIDATPEIREIKGNADIFMDAVRDYIHNLLLLQAAGGDIFGMSFKTLDKNPALLVFYQAFVRAGDRLYDATNKLLDTNVATCPVNINRDIDEIATAPAKSRAE